MLLVCGGLVLGSPTAVQAASASAPGIEFFETRIRPVLVKHCYECHSAQAAKVRGGLLLDTAAGLRAGGDSGPVIVPGNVKDSLLLASLRHEAVKMPPREKLPAAVIADFEAWIRMGAPDPRTEARPAAYRAMTLEEARSFWSFRPLRKPEAPRVQDGTWPRTDIDRFMLARLEAQQLRPVADKERRTLIRRLSFDLLGLPPTPEAVEAFVQDRSPQAVERLVDQLLASPHFGERWGRYWLDGARYGESNGGVGANNNSLFPHAWRYRDYVIASLNRDKPYDQFIREQLAGDLLPARDAAERDELLIATGFLALTSRPPSRMNPNYEMDLIADQIDVTCRTVLGLTVLCARCHDHKFDPISTREYYALAGIFKSTGMLHGGFRTPLHALSDGGKAMGVQEARPNDCRICLRGESQDLGDSVPRGFLRVATPGAMPTILPSQSGRVQLAQWLTAPDNPLPARVAVNRIWLHLFGQGLCRTVDNFGALGERPSHPELLDYLAARFIEEGWSIKRMIRAMVLSRTYQLGSDHDPANAEQDADNIGLWRMNLRRLDAEALRDAILTVSGQLDLQPPRQSLAPAKPGERAAESNHRSIYLGIVRSQSLPEILNLFDGADPQLIVSQRDVTTVPTQALFFLNSPFVLAQSQFLAKRLLAVRELDSLGRVDQAYRLAYARPAASAEREQAVRYLQQVTETHPKDELLAWTQLCQAILASAEFRYRD